MEARMTILGLWRADNTILDNLYLPEQISATEVKNRLLVEGAELEVLYPDPDFFKEAVTNYSALRLHAWQTMADVLYKDNYDPFTNVNRHEERTETESRNLREVVEGETENSVSAYNVDTYSKANKSNTNGINQNTGTITRSMTYDLTGDSALSDTQDLIRKEIELRQNYDLYKIIVSDILYNFCLLIY